MRMLRHAAPLLLGAALHAPAELPADFAGQYARLAALVDREELGAMDMARGSLDAARFIAAGTPGIAWLEPRFKNAATFGEASVAGLYLTVWGRDAHWTSILKELEINPQKRAWLNALVGTPERFNASLAGGEAYQPLIRLLPSVGGSRALAMKCIGSKDPLVRRAGLFWGYWLADAPYWKAVRELARTETDRATLHIAQQLLLRGAGA